VQSFGWEAAAHYDGLTSGTTGLSKRLEAITVEKGPKLEKMRGDIEYRVHCQTYGWMDWVKNGELAGTEGEAKRLEGIEIKLVKKNTDMQKLNADIIRKFVRDMHLQR
jgi:uncharacterized protein YjdB